MLTLRHFRAFLAVAETGNFTRAAAHLHMSQTALTNCIRQLEDDVGVELFDRTQRPVVTTRYGEDFVQTAERLASQLELAAAQFRSRPPQHGGEVGISAIPSIANEWIPEILTPFARDHPNVMITVYEDDSFGVKRRILRGEADLGFAQDWQEDSRLAYSSLIEEQLCLVCRPDHPLASRSSPLQWRDLIDCTFIRTANDWKIRSVVKARPELGQTLLETPYRIMNIAVLVNFVSESVGVTVLPPSTIPARHRSALRFIPLHDPSLTRTVSLIYRKNETMRPWASALLRAFTDVASARNQS